MGLAWRDGSGHIRRPLHGTPREPRGPSVARAIRGRGEPKARLQATGPSRSPKRAHAHAEQVKVFHTPPGRRAGAEGAAKGYLRPGSSFTSFEISTGLPQGSPADPRLAVHPIPGDQTSPALTTKRKLLQKVGTDETAGYTADSPCLGSRQATSRKRRVRRGDRRCSSGNFSQWCPRMGTVLRSRLGLAETRRVAALRSAAPWNALWNRVPKEEREVGHAASREDDRNGASFNFGLATLGVHC